MSNVPPGYCAPLWDEKKRMGAQHILRSTASDRWAGRGEDMPQDIEFLLRDQIALFTHAGWRKFYWKVNIDYLECRNCDHGDIVITSRNDGLVYNPIIRECQIIDLGEDEDDDG